MSRDHRKLRVFEMADSLVIDIYKMTKDFPTEELYGVTSQLRRGSLSAASNIVEGCARRGEREYGNFLNIANGSACEVRYVLSVAFRLGYIKPTTLAPLDRRYSRLIAGLVRLMKSLDDQNPASPSVDPRP